nr:beta-glucosidase 44-like [Ipomoea batatas]
MIVCLVFIYADARNGVPIGPRANSEWLYMVPWGLYKAVTYVKERYGNPLMFLSENGFTVGMDYMGNLTLAESLNDTKRINYYKSYMAELKRVVDEGANLFGYFAWSLLDNFEWRIGYTSRFGIVYVDFNTLKRYLKMSAYWFKIFLLRNNH